MSDAKPFDQEKFIAESKEMRLKHLEEQARGPFGGGGGKPSLPSLWGSVGGKRRVREERKDGAENEGLRGERTGKKMGGKGRGAGGGGGGAAR